MTELRKELTSVGEIRYVGQDHALDCLRYIVMSRPRAPKPIEPPTPMTSLDRLKVGSEQSFRRQFRESVHGGTTWF
jgi:hypothetical protein